MLTLKVGREITLYFNEKQHKAIITQIDFGEIVWVRFEDKLANEEYYHIDELEKRMDPNNIGQIIDEIEEDLHI
ncbi:hypothetical protein [Pelosinus sp. sgz500959]|uniref:hypothetical protein n=1 Tax=Pelosinus sp. sgz500959 TaxID=3242472 RepID=UPI00366F8259